MARTAEIIGGPRDGEFVPISGAYLYQHPRLGVLQPVKRGARTYTYWLRVTLDGQYHYVYREPHAMP